jgi:ankyrin repeat protein
MNQIYIPDTKMFLSWMTDDPGRQLLTGSFHPIDSGEWSVQAYLGATEKLFKAIADNDRETVGDILRTEGLDLRVRDHVGRTCLHLALLAKRSDIAMDLIDAGARITSRLVDGRTALHLAAQHGLDNVVKKLLERSQANERAEEEKAAEEKAKAAAETSGSEMESDNETARASSDDDWDSDEDMEEEKPKKEAVKAAKEDMPTVNDPPAEGANLPEDNEELPDILDINAVDWDLNWSPLVHAIVGGHHGVVDNLLRAGADARTPWKTNETYNQRTIYPLSMAIYNEDEKSACRIVERLLEAGASSTASGHSSVSVFHSAVSANALAVVRTMLRVDPNALTALNFLARPDYNQAILPLVTAINSANRPMVALLLAYGSITSITERDFDKSWDISYAQNTNRYWPQKQPNQWLNDTYMPLETVLSRRSDALPLIKLSSDPNLYSRNEQSYWSSNKYVRCSSISEVLFTDRA